MTSALAAYGLDISWHRSHQVNDADLAWADLVLGMSREHVRHAVVTAPDAWPRAFTLKEMVRRGEETGPRMPGEPLGGLAGQGARRPGACGAARGLSARRRGRPHGRTAAGLR